MKRTARPHRPAQFIIHRVSILLALFVGLAGVGTALAQPAGEEVAPPAAADTGEEAAEVSAESREAAEKALREFQQKAQEAGVDTEALERTARGVLDDAGVSEEDLEAAARQLREAAENANIDAATIEQAAGRVREELDELRSDGISVDAEDRQTAIEALEELGRQADEALRDDEVLVDDAEMDATEAAAFEAVEGTEDLGLPGETAEDLLNPLLEEETESAPSAAEMARARAEAVLDSEAIDRIEARRDEILAQVNAERDAKQARINFQKALTVATQDPDLVALKASAAEAPTFEESRAFLTEYYEQLFAKIESMQPRIKDYIQERKQEYMLQIERQLPRTEPFDLTAGGEEEDGAAAEAQGAAPAAGQPVAPRERESAGPLFIEG